MKKYFTKYLPVEGEITENDMVWDSEDNTMSSANDLLMVVDDLNHLNIFSNYSKMKLFLCSRDIQVGDTVVGLPDCPTAIVDEKNLNYLSEHPSWIKVIGEISPDALSFVWEGQEFDKDEMQILLHHDTEPLPYSEDMPSANISQILVKGPCGHFH